jgi:hypothetical protein
MSLYEDDIIVFHSTIIEIQYSLGKPFPRPSAHCIDKNYDLYLVPAVEIGPPTALLFREAAGGRVEAQQAAHGGRTLHTYGPQVWSSQMVSSVVLYSGSILCSRCFPSTNSGVRVLTTPLLLFSAIIPFSVLIPPSYSLSSFLLSFSFFLLSAALPLSSPCFSCAPSFLFLSCFLPIIFPFSALYPRSRSSPSFKISFTCTFVPFHFLY